MELLCGVATEYSLPEAKRQADYAGGRTFTVHLALCGDLPTETLNHSLHRLRGEAIFCALSARLLHR